MNQYIYDVFLTSAKNKCFDLVNMALPMLLSDAKTGERQYTDEQTDLEQLHTDYPVLVEQEGQMRKFIGWHYNALVDAFQARDRAAFDTVVAQCEAEDKEDAENDGDATEGEAE